MRRKACMPRVANKLAFIKHGWAPWMKSNAARSAPFVFGGVLTLPQEF
jgi:hypothetical protein